MTYGAYEQSVQDGRPVELYDFEIGGVHYRYTSTEDEVLYSAWAYAPRQITRTAPKMGSNAERQTLEMTLPTDDPVCFRFVGIAPPEPVTVQIIRFHRGDSPNGHVIWEGRVSATKFEKQGALCRLYTVSTESALTRPIPADKYQSVCNHLLFDSRCGADKETFKYQDNVTAKVNNVITVSGLFAAHGADWALGGTVEYDGDYRLVLGQDGDDLTLSMPFLSSPVGQQVDVFAGCKHNLDTCRDKFSNLINYGGFPYVPTKNPFSSGVN